MFLHLPKFAFAVILLSCSQAIAPTNPSGSRSPASSPTTIPSKALQPQVPTKNVLLLYPLGSLLPAGSTLNVTEASGQQWATIALPTSHASTFSESAVQALESQFELEQQDSTDWARELQEAKRWVQITSNLSDRLESNGRALALKCEALGYLRTIETDAKVPPEAAQECYEKYLKLFPSGEYEGKAKWRLYQYSHWVYEYEGNGPGAYQDAEEIRNLLAEKDLGNSEVDAKLTAISKYLYSIRDDCNDGYCITEVQKLDAICKARALMTEVEGSIDVSQHERAKELRWFLDKQAADCE